MIFVTIGSHTPFDRLVRTVDAWAAGQSDRDIFAQIGDGAYLPQHMRYERHLDPDTFEHAVQRAKVIVGHAGTGTIISALQFGKPILVMPRCAALRETRNDHQVATAARFAERGYVVVARDEHELSVALDDLEALPERARIGRQASPELIQCIRTFIEDGRCSVPSARADRSL
mgnify:CR=1 FL=1